jgi:hypothetical protein
MQWRGPYEIIKKVGNADYRIDMNGKIKTFHANMLKLYIDRANEDDACVLGVAELQIWMMTVIQLKMYCGTHRDMTGKKVQ